MRLNTLRKSFGNYYYNNQLKYFIMLLVFVAGLTAGMLVSCTVDEKYGIELTETILNSFKSIEDKSVLKTFFSFTYKNLKCISAVILTAFCMYFMPLLFINMGMWGFSIGFTSGVMSLCFGGVGVLLSILIMLTQFVFIVPLVMFLSVTALDYTLHNIKSSRNARRLNRKKLLVICAGTFFVLLLFSLPDIFVVPHMIKAVSMLI